MVIFIIALLLSFFFAFWNGFTDAAYAISTVIGTRVLSPAKAVALSAVGHFAGLLFGTAVAQTIGKGIVEGNVVSGQFILAVLIGGLAWDIATWFFALPISETHVLIGALIGAGIVAGGIQSVKITSIFDKVVIPMVSSPLIAFVFAFLFTALIIRLFGKFPAGKMNRWFAGLQIVSSFMFSVSHGSNDAQKTMGIITLLLFQQGLIKEFSVPLWVMVFCYLALSLGTLFGGWRIVKTLSRGITKMRPYQEFSAEASSSLIILTTAILGIPVSTTHAISGAIMGVGATRGASAVRWTTARKMVIAWVLTMPLSAAAAALVYFLLKLIL